MGPNAIAAWPAPTGGQEQIFHPCPGGGSRGRSWGGRLPLPWAFHQAFHVLDAGEEQGDRFGQGGHGVLLEPVQAGGDIREVGFQPGRGLDC